MKRAVIVEPRKHPGLEVVINNIGSASGLPVTIVHGGANVEFAREIANRSEHVDVLSQINADNLDLVAYNKLLLAPDFYDNIGAKSGEKILIFHTDAGACGTGGVGKAALYDYCGAP
jgi:hypothetical protein